MIYRVILCDGDNKRVIAVHEDKEGKPAGREKLWPVWDDIQGKTIEYEVCKVGDLDVAQDVFVKLPA